MKLLTASLITFLSVSLISCSSKKEACGCPYQSQIEEKELFYIDEDLATPLLVSEPNLRSSLCFDILSPSDFFVDHCLKKSIGSDLFSNIIDHAFGYKGIRYRRGGLGENGFDCSGFVYKTFSSFGINLPRTSFDMSNVVTEVSRKEAKKGDLIFFKTNRRKGRINHVGLVIEVNGKEIKFIHSSIKNGVIVSSTLEDYYARTYAKVGRIQNS